MRFTRILLLILFLPLSAIARDDWKGCEDAIAWIPVGVTNIAGGLDYAEREDIPDFQTTLVLPKGMGCSSDTKFKDMPSSLQLKMLHQFEMLDDDPMPRSGVEDLNASEVLNLLLVRAQGHVNAKVRSTLLTKVIGAREAIQQEKDELKAELKKRKSCGGKKRCPR